MKREINRIMIVCMLIGFCMSPSILKSQSVKTSRSVSTSINSDLQYNFNNWFSLNHFFDSDWSSDENEAIKADSLKNTLETERKSKCSDDSPTPKCKKDSLKRIRKANFRNMPVVIETRI